MLFDCPVITGKIGTAAPDAVARENITGLLADQREIYAPTPCIPVRNVPGIGLVTLIGYAGPIDITGEQFLPFAVSPFNPNPEGYEPGNYAVYFCNGVFNHDTTLGSGGWMVSRFPQFATQWNGGFAIEVIVAGQTFRFNESQPPGFGWTAPQQAENSAFGIFTSFTYVGDAAGAGTMALHFTDQKYTDNAPPVGLPFTTPIFGIYGENLRADQALQAISSSAVNNGDGTWTVQLQLKNVGTVERDFTATLSGGAGVTVLFPNFQLVTLSPGQIATLTYRAIFTPSPPHNVTVTLSFTSGQSGSNFGGPWSGTISFLLFP